MGELTPEMIREAFRILREREGYGQSGPELTWRCTECGRLHFSRDSNAELKCPDVGDAT